MPLACHSPLREWRFPIGMTITAMEIGVMLEKCFASGFVPIAAAIVATSEVSHFFSGRSSQ